MTRRLLAIVLCLPPAGFLWSLEPDAQKLADRYYGLLEGNPAQSAVLDRLWRIYADAGETPALLELARREPERHPVLTALILERAGETAEARQILARVAPPGDARAAEELARIVAKEEGAAAAARMLETLPAAQNSPALLVKLGALWQEAGEGAKARTAWEEAAKLAPDDLALRRKLADAALAGGDPAGAVAHLRAIAEKGAPAERFAAMEEISLREEEAGRLDHALAAQAALLDLMGPGHWKLSSARYRLFHLHERSGTLAELEKQWTGEADGRPREPDFILRLAELHEFQGDNAKRLARLRQASELLPRDANLLTRVAAMEILAGQFAAAAQSADRALALRPGDADLIFQRAEIAALAGRETEAEQQVEAFLAAHPDEENAEAQARSFYQRLRLSRPLEHRLAASFAARPREKEAALTLARFYLDEYRFKEAADALARFDDSKLAPGEAAAAAREFSEILLHAGMTDEAVAWSRRAWEKNPADAENALHLASLLDARGDTGEARAVLIDAATHSTGLLPKEELDRRLFLALQTQDGGIAAREGPVAIPPKPDGKAVPGLAVSRMIEALQLAAAKNGANGWLRLARWLRWKGNLPGAVAAIQKGLGEFTDSPALHEAMGDFLVASGQSPAAIKSYLRLAQLSPERAPELRRKVARLQLDGGNIPEGLGTFDAIARENPRDWQAVSDLALAEQVAGNWYKAMETWLRASQLAPADARRGMRQSILNAASRLQLHDRALDYLEQACAEEGDPAPRNDLLREAAAFAVRHNVAAGWRARLERKPGEKAWKMGAVFLLEEEGRENEARQLLAQVLQNDDESGAITWQLDAAEKAGDWAGAARLARRLAALDRKNDPAPWTRLAENQERAGDVTGATGTWETAMARFARDAGTLAAAADFFERGGDEDRMEKAQRAAARLGTCAPPVFLRLGELALDRGDRNQALADFEAVLARTQPDPQAIPPPAPLTLLKNNPEEADKSTSPRLAALRHSAQLLANSPEKPKWLPTFSGAELAWALFYSGETARALEEMERIDEKEPAWEAGFAALAWEAGEGQRLARWAEADPEKRDKRWEQILAAFSSLLEAGWRPADQVIAETLADAPALKHWEACLRLVSHREFRGACALGESVPDLLPASQALPAWIKLAEWRIALREPDRAIACLDRAIASATPATSFANPLFSAIRARWLLTLPEERPAFARRTLARLQTLSQEGCVLAAGALLAALNGDEETAAEKLEALFAWREISGTEEWQEFIQQGGSQLEEWRLPRLARALYRLEWQGDRALASLRGADMQRATRTLFVFNRLADADAPEIPYLLSEWTARGVTEQELLLATRARGISPSTSAMLYQMLSDRQPHNEIIIAALLMGAPTSQAETFLRHLLAGDQTPGVRARMSAAGVHRSAALEEDQEYDRALDLIARLRAGIPNDPALLNRHARLLATLGRHREALAELEKGPRSPDTDAMLAELRARFGRETPAAAPSKTGAAEKPLPKTAAERYDAGSLLLLGSPELSPEVRARELSRLKKIAAKNPAFLPRFHLLRKNLAASHREIPALERELWAEWQGGSYFAGEILLQICLEQKRFGEIGSILDRWLTEDFYNETAWQNYGAALLEAGRPELAARVLGAFVARAPSNTAAALLLAQALWKSGRPEEAETVLAPLRRIAALDPGYLPGLAHLALAINRPDEAWNQLDAIPKEDGSTARLWVDLARQLLAADRLPTAREALFRAAPFSPNGLVDTIADYYAAAGQLGQTEPGSNEFDLRSSMLRLFRVTMAERLLATGDNERAWLWFETHPNLLNDTAARHTLESLESLDTARMARLWEAAIAQTALWDTRQAAAQFYLRRAQAEPDNALKHLVRAHELQPGSFAIAKAGAGEYLRRGQPEAARKMLQDVIDSYADAGDRHAAREMLATLQAAPALPERG